MAQRPLWRGHLRLALVLCPVALYSAHHDRGALRFNLINPETGNRINTVTLDSETRQEVSRRDLVKGYEFKKNTYVILTEEDFESARVESSSTINVEKFVDATTIDPVYFDASYYIGPDGNVGVDVYAVLRDAIASTGKMALARVVISRRERAIAIAPMGKGLVAHTLHDENDLNAAGNVFDRLPDAKSDPEMIKLATQLIERQAGVYDPADVADRYEARLREVIDAKLKGEGIDVLEEVVPDRGNVVDLMAALRKSLGQSEEPVARKAAPKKAAQPKEPPVTPPRSSGRKRA